MPGDIEYQTKVQDWKSQGVTLAPILCEKIIQESISKKIYSVNQDNDCLSNCLSWSQAFSSMVR